MSYLHDVTFKEVSKNASKRIVQAGSVTASQGSDIEIVDRWRRAHLKPLTSIAMWLRKPAQEATGLPPAQRLKRRDTVLDKIISGRSKDVATMQDLGGCRIIFPSVESLEEFRHYLRAKSRARHEPSHADEKFDYIARPKPTGYRGVHYVFGYSPSSRTSTDLVGLKVEVQLRTEVQHAWATAVEIADLVLGARTKFEDGTGIYGEFFRLASELLARRHEGRVSCEPNLSDNELKGRFLVQEDETHLLDRLDKLREQGDLDKINKHTVLAFRGDGKLEIYGYTKAVRAVRKEAELLEDASFTHVVYVRASTVAAIRNSYRNYLTNPADFVKLMREALH